MIILVIDLVYMYAKSKKNWTTPENLSLPQLLSLQAHGVPFWVIKTTWHHTAMVSI